MDEKKSRTAWIRKKDFCICLQEIIRYKTIIQLVVVALDEKQLHTSLTVGKHIAVSMHPAAEQYY